MPKLLHSSKTLVSGWDHRSWAYKPMETKHAISHRSREPHPWNLPCKPSGWPPVIPKLWRLWPKRLQIFTAVCTQREYGEQTTTWKAESFLRYRERLLEKRFTRFHELTINAFGGTAPASGIGVCVPGSNWAATLQTIKKQSFKAAWFLRGSAFSFFTKAAAECCWNWKCCW